MRSDPMEGRLESGCNDYVTKPIDKVELITKIENLIRLDSELDRD